MKKFILRLFVVLLLVEAIFLERSDKVWPLDRVFMSFLAKVTHHAPPAVTAVKMPLVQSHLSPQDVALVFRAIIGFYPHQIFVLEPVSDSFGGPFSLLREAIEGGEIQGVPIHFLTNENFQRSKVHLAANVHLISLEDLLLRREERERGSILPELDILFTNKTVLLGGPQVAEQASCFLNQAEKKLILPAGVELVFLFLLFLLIMKWKQLPWVDFLLLLVGILFCFVMIDAWLFQARNIAYPLIAPSVMLAIVVIIKLLSCTQKVKK